MIKLFRKIRQNTLAKQKARRYIQYAVGETVLVVIGILIAIQINNWNEKRIQLNKGQLLLKEMIVEIESNINLFNHIINALERNIQTQDELFQIEDIGKLPMDSLELFLSDVNLNILASSNTYDKSQMIGIYKLSSSETLNDEISTYYRLDVYSINKWLKRKYDLFTAKWDYVNNHDIQIWNSEYVKGWDRISDEESKTNLLSFINLPITQAILEISYLNQKEALHSLNAFNEKSIHLLHKIHSELNASNPNLEPLAED